VPHSAFTLDEKTILEKTAKVPVDVVKAMLLTGTVDDVLGQAAEWRDHGVRYFVVLNFGPSQPNVRGALATLGPFNSVVRGLKRL
jgi:phthiodiolone/phenolphthiodiolone dimycocerosates ketoreductase